MNTTTLTSINMPVTGGILFKEPGIPSRFRLFDSFLEFSSKSDSLESRNLPSVTNRATMDNNITSTAECQKTRTKGAFPDMILKEIGKDSMFDGDALNGFRKMFATSGDWYEGIDEDPYSAVFIVRDSLQADDGARIVPDEEDAFECFSRALLGMLSCYDADDETRRRLDAWTKNRIRKIVKRAHGSKWRKALEYAATADIPSVRAFSDKVEVLCFAPMKASEQEKPVKQLQVSGLDLERAREEVPSPPSTLLVSVGSDLEMTTGKACAQVGHAIQLAIRHLDDDAYGKWADSGFACAVRRASIVAGSPHDVMVCDAGFTEVAPGSITACADLSN